MEKEEVFDPNTFGVYRGSKRGRPKKYGSSDARKAAKLADKKRWYEKHGGTDVVEYNKKYYEAHKAVELEPGSKVMFSPTSYERFPSPKAKVVVTGGFGNVCFFYPKYA
ncbi:MAG: hypothetical protein Harvfovirus40_4 [Harvfovirus sp.]|uniref:Uncharacterized protein n=1 Tax=Harvfovirus sp. TaxID=2487768 RepID=A0A3G5A5L6_9VIRU|nr:MAG: hypothetical protein Harvfovirus40_4 [Harvfovirus sp.]